MSLGYAFTEIEPVTLDPARLGLGCHLATITTLMRDGVWVGGGGMDAPSLRTSVEAPRGSRSPEPQKKKFGDKPRNIENEAYWGHFPIVAVLSMCLLAPIGCLV